tara:strand:- start:290 stop:586 length:297 start_codon:yes stop_codon:yes gene_type:complete
MSFNYRRYHAIQRGYKGDEYLKKRLLSNWGKVGLQDNLEDVFLIYKDQIKCEICDIELENKGHGKNRKVMNHCHTTGWFLNILCMSCNIHEHHDNYWS